MVNWSAVAFGWLVDFSLKMLLQLIVFWSGAQQFYQQPDLSEFFHLLILVVLLTITALGGFVAARLAETAFWLHGLLVGLVAILAGAVANPTLIAIPPLLIYTQIVACLLAAACGGLAGMVHRRTTPSSE